MKTIEEELEDLKRGYSKTTKTRFMYNQDIDLDVSCNTIVCFYLLYRESVGYTIFKCFYARRVMSVGNWVRFLKEKSHEIFINRILPHLKKDTDIDDGYKFIKFISWRFPKPEDSKNPHAHAKIKFA